MNTPVTIRALIDERARQFPDKPFLLAPLEDDAASDKRPRALTFGELRDECVALAAGFSDAGLRPGDVISVYMGNGLQTASLLLAAMYGGYVANPLNLLCQPSQVRYIVEHSDTRAIFVSRDSRDAIETAIAELRAQGFEREILLIETQPDAVEVPVFAQAELAFAETPRVAHFAPATQEDVARADHADRRCRVADVHVRHDRRAEGRAAHASQPARERAQHHAPSIGSAPATACSPRCRSITSTGSW